jgi:ERCC4-type nuclease
MATLLIDTREIKFIEKSVNLMENNKNNIEIKQLELGDFIILSNTNNIIIERKTIDDLQKSIVDGRYRNQKKRLLEYSNKLSESGKNSKIIYILEGSLNELDKKYKKIFWGMIINCCIRDSIFTIQVPSIDKTVDVIFNMFEKIQNNTNGCANIGPSTNINLSSYKKSKYITPQSCYISQLCQIPGISIKIAEAIHLEYKNFQILIDSLVNLNEKERIDKLSIIYVGNEDHRRKLGKKISEKIVNHIFFN